MDETSPPPNILTFPGSTPEPLEPHEDATQWPWAPIPLLEDAPSSAPPQPLWLEEQITLVLLRARRFHLAVAKLDTIDRVPVNDLIDAFVEGDRALFRVLETLRLRRPERREALDLWGSLKALVETMNEQRVAVIATLEGDIRRRFLLRERRSGPSPLDLEEELRRRVTRREIASKRGEVAIRAGGITLPLPAPEELALRRRRLLRREQDSLPALQDAPLATLIKRLPLPWLRGMVHQLGLGQASQGPRQVLEERVVEGLTNPLTLRRALASLPFRSFRILEALLSEGGVSRFDLLIHRFGSEDETSWYWDREPPRGNLERIRRIGLLMVGSTELKGKEYRLGYIPKESRPLLREIFRESPRQPWISPDLLG